jgi:hypothetical protein
MVGKILVWSSERVRLALTYDIVRDDLTWCLKSPFRPPFFKRGNFGGFLTPLGKREEGEIFEWNNAGVI